MKNAPKFAIALIAAACVSTSAFASETPKEQPLEKVAPYPKADKGMTRQVIQLPVQQDEANYKVELLIGKTLEVDCNQHACEALAEIFGNNNAGIIFACYYSVFRLLLIYERPAHLRVLFKIIHYLIADVDFL